MKVFLSWSGERSRAVAKALDTWIPDVLVDTSTWMSDERIEAGSRWSVELEKELESSSFGILCLTPENLNSPWLLFEAGAISKIVTKSRVVPYRFGLNLSDVPYPLAQFQGVDANDVGTMKLLFSMNSLRETPLAEERLKRLSANWWPALQKNLENIPDPTGHHIERRDDRALLEEIVEHVRRLKSESIQDEQLRTIGESAVTLYNLEQYDIFGGANDTEQFQDALKRGREHYERLVEAYARKRK